MLLVHDVSIWHSSLQTAFTVLMVGVKEPKRLSC
jgi:hypothetical protein